jgi:hypothetical protein
MINDSGIWRTEYRNQICVLCDELRHCQNDKISKTKLAGTPL